MILATFVPWKLAALDYLDTLVAELSIVTVLAVPDLFVFIRRSGALPITAVVYYLMAFLYDLDGFASRQGAVLAWVGT